MRQIVLEQGYDLVHVHTPIAAFLTRFALRKLRPKVKVVYTAHGFHFGHSDESPYVSPFIYVEKLAASWTDGLFVSNREDFDTAREYRLVDDDRLFYSPGIGIDLEHYHRHTIPLDEIRRVRSELGLGSSDFLLLMLAEFIPSKQHRDALKAFELVAGPDIHVAFAGDGPLFDEIKAAGANLKFSRHLHFPGYRHDIPALIAASDATVLSCRQEGLPRSIMESIALGTPVIGSRTRGITEFFPIVVGPPAKKRVEILHNEAKPSLGSFDVGDIALPHPARSIWRRHLRKPVFRDLVIVTTFGSAGPKTAFLFRTQTLLPHEPGNAVLPAVLAPFAQIKSNTRAAISATTLLKAAADQSPQPLVTPTARTSPLMQMGVEAAFGDFQRLGQFLDGALPLHGFHDAEPCGGISADKMLQAFFSISRWRRR